VKCKIKLKLVNLSENKKNPEAKKSELPSSSTNSNNRSFGLLRLLLNSNRSSDAAFGKRWDFERCEGARRTEKEKRRFGRCRRKRECRRGRKSHLHLKSVK